MLVSFVPLLVVSSGLLVTFSAGLWNIGVEGQITLGAIATTWVLRLLQDSSLPAGLIIALAMLAGMLGGAIWASLAGALKTYGGVNEIFGGLGLNFVATALTLWLIFGPWKRPGIGSMSGTEPFPDSLWMPMITGFRLSPWALGIGILFIILIYFLLKGTHFGLRIKAVGKNIKAAYLHGVPTTRYLMLAFILGGGLAGLTGAIQVTAVYHRLIPSISSGYGFLGLLVAMLVNYQAIWVVPVALFFAALEHRQYSTTHRTETGFDPLRSAAGRVGVVRPADGWYSPEDHEAVRRWLMTNECDPPWVGRRLGHRCTVDLCGHR